MEPPPPPRYEYNGAQANWSSLPVKEQNIDIEGQKHVSYHDANHVWRLRKNTEGRVYYIDAKTHAEVTQNDPDVAAGYKKAEEDRKRGEKNATDAMHAQNAALRAQKAAQQASSIGSSGDVMGDLVAKQLGMDPAAFFRFKVTLEQAQLGKLPVVDGGSLSLDVDASGGTTRLADGFEVTQGADGEFTSFTYRGVTVTKDGRVIFRATVSKGVSVTEAADIKNIFKTMAADAIRLLQIRFRSDLGPSANPVDAEELNRH